MLLFEERYPGADHSSFIDKVNNYSYKLGVDPNWLMYVMNTESGLNPQAVNNSYTYSDGSHSVGLNQMGGVVLRSIGYPGTWQDFKNLSGSEQMDWVYKYFKPYAGRIKNYKDMYLANFYPGYLGRDPSTQFPYSVVAANRIFDINHDGTLTLQEFYNFLDQKARGEVPASLMSSFFDQGTGQVAQWNFIQTHQRDIIIWVFAILILASLIFVGYLIFKR